MRALLFCSALFLLFSAGLFSAGCGDDDYGTNLDHSVAVDASSTDLSSSDK